MTAMGTDFSDPALQDQLDAASPDELDALGFGVIRMDSRGHVTAYNRCEAEAAGLKPERVLGRHFFSEVGPCTQNQQISQPLLEATALDTVFDYVFALRMKITPVRLRLLKSPTSAHMYLLVQR
jgi:photoactive yellow protein